MTYFNKVSKCTFFKVIKFLIIISLCANYTVWPARDAYAQSVLNLPRPGIMISISPAFTPPIIRGMSIYPDNPLQFDFIVDGGDERIQGEELRISTDKLIKYFLATLAMPENEMWVNLSPYEKDRIIPDSFGATEMGRDLLAQDYMLKQLTASLMYPEEELGKEFWQRVYTKAQERYGTSEIPMNTFNKIWIVPDQAEVYVNGTNVFVAESHLKVMLEEDYLALDANKNSTEHGLGEMTQDDIEVISGVSSEIVKEVLIPEIENEVNNGKHFATLRQIYHSMILATWYKQNLKKSLLGAVYVDQKKTKGVEVEDVSINQKIYDQYVKAFEKGVFNFIREDYDEASQQVIPRKYFSGGIKAAVGGKIKETDEGAVLEDRWQNRSLNTASLTLDPIRNLDRLLGLLRSIPESTEQGLPELTKDSNLNQIMEFIIAVLKKREIEKEYLSEGDLIRDTFDEEGNRVIALSERVRKTNLGKAIEQEVINPVDSDGVAAIHLYPNRLIVGFESDLNRHLRNENGELAFDEQERPITQLRLEQEEIRLEIEEGIRNPARVFNQARRNLGLGGKFIDETGVEIFESGREDAIIRASSTGTELNQSALVSFLQSYKGDALTMEGLISALEQEIGVSVTRGTVIDLLEQDDVSRSVETFTSNAVRLIGRLAAKGTLNNIATSDA